MRWRDCFPCSTRIPCGPSSPAPARRSTRRSSSPHSRPHASCCANGWTAAPSSPSLHDDLAYPPGHVHPGGAAAGADAAGPGDGDPVGADPGVQRAPHDRDHPGPRARHADPEGDHLRRRLLDRRHAGAPRRAPRGGLHRPAPPPAPERGQGPGDPHRARRLHGGDRHRAGRRPRVRPAGLARAPRADHRREGGRLLRLPVPRGPAPGAVLLALRGEHGADPVLEHADEPEPDRHGDLLQGGPGGPGAGARGRARVGPVRVRARDHGAARPAGRADLRGADLVRGPDVCRGEEDQLEGRRRRLLAHPEVQLRRMTDQTRRWLLPTTVALLALAACITSIGHDFTYDDRYVIMMNDRVHSLQSFWKFFGQSYWPPKFGGDGYRPLVILLFAVQWAISDGAAWVFHLTNILLAVGTALAVYWMALVLLPPAGAWLAGALFAVHPVHVEVTGNMVGQAELVVGLSLAVAMGWYLRRRADGTLGMRDVGVLSLLYGI